MLRLKSGWWLASVLALLGVAPSAHAQWAVIDVGAIAQLVQQVQTAEQQLQTAENQLSQAQQHFQAITGTRGMQNLLSGTVRNYLPTDMTSLLATLNGTAGAYSALSASVQSLVNTNSVLSPAALAALSPAERDAVQTQRQTVALLQGLSQQALANSSSQFASIQQLISAIGTATDPKGILDLHARISAEQGMLQNEQTKLQVLNQAVTAQAAAAQQRASEQAITDVGSLRNLPPMGL
jgi:type IV secretion system protein VirB5